MIDMNYRLGRGWTPQQRATAERFGAEIAAGIRRLTEPLAGVRQTIKQTEQSIREAVAELVAVEREPFLAGAETEEPQEAARDANRSTGPPRKQSPPRGERGEPLEMSLDCDVPSIAQKTDPTQAEAAVIPPLIAKARRRAHVELLSRRAGAAGFVHRDLGRLILIASNCRQHLADANHLRARESFSAFVEHARHAGLWLGECWEAP